ncbi:HlyD family secretion protein [Legionella fairfieldensis]|uniref:HlyD family secretion protein n=1 Tax=Legionella fairfieldensis TaxID=45064 RepID=UPI00048D2A0A|nr:HlyD family efflux transporter periplasmic adaptor subunit [Legionella fairfieldensis]
MHRLIFSGLITLFLIACQSNNENNNHFGGYIDTDLVYLSADFGGRLVERPVRKGQLVQNNQLLFKLEQTNELYTIEMSQLSGKDLLAQRQQIAVQHDYNTINYHRIQGMRKQNAASQNDLEVAKKDLDASQHQLEEIDFKIKNNQVDTTAKKWVAKRKESYAPQSGIIFDTYYTPGEFVQGGYPVLSLITAKNLKVIFFVPQPLLSHITLNGRVNILTDGKAEPDPARISYISNIAEYTSPIIYSQAERQKLVFRVEAKLENPDLEQTHLGQPVTVEPG